MAPGTVPQHWAHGQVTKQLPEKLQSGLLAPSNQSQQHENSAGKREGASPLALRRARKTASPLREHAYSLKTGTGSNLATHCKACKACKCSPRLEDTKVLKRFRDTRAREIYEAWEIAQRGADCVSTPSVALYQKELVCLNM